MLLERTNKQLKKIYKGIEKYCKDCDLCCFTYGWIMPCEESRYSKITNLISINKKVTCFDSFEENKFGGKCLEKIPRCKFYRSRKCKIHQIKPFDCLLYPVKVLYHPKKRRYSVVLSLDCPYIESLNKEDREYLKRQIVSFFSSMPEKIRKEYFSLVRDWEGITYRKEFESLEICSFSEDEIKLA